MIPVFDRHFSDDSLLESIQEAFSDVVEQKIFVLGKSVSRFEVAFSDYVGVREAIGVGNGTDALELALRACGVSEGKKVATQANAGFYTSSAIVNLGATPIYIDVELQNAAPSIDQVSEALEFNPTAIVITHLYGQLNPSIAEIAALCEKRNVTLIEDCAQAHGANLEGRFAGSFGALSTFSFYPTKNLGALGDGGALLVNDPAFGKRARSLRQYGWSEKYRSEEVGRNSRLDELQAAFLLVELDNLETYNLRRRAIANSYSQRIIPRPGQLELFDFVINESYVAHLFPIRVSPSLRQNFVDYLSFSGVSTAVHFPIPDHKQPAMQHIQFEIANSLATTELLSKSVVSLPMFPQLTDSQVDSVISAVNSWNSL